ncbi:hypothetical protein STEG23_003477, partial [Scotinomys teguina]
AMVTFKSAGDQASQHSRTGREGLVGPHTEQQSSDNRWLLQENQRAGPSEAPSVPAFVVFGCSVTSNERPVSKERPVTPSSQPSVRDFQGCTLYNEILFRVLLIPPKDPE